MFLCGYEMQQCDILGFSHDIYPVVFARVMTRESGTTVFKKCNSQTAGSDRNITIYIYQLFTDVKPPTLEFKEKIMLNLLGSMLA